MLLLRTLECLLYLVLFTLLLDFVKSASLSSSHSEENTLDSVTKPPASTSSHTNREDMRRAFDSCHEQLSWLCLKIKFVKFMERLTEQEEFNLIGGISVVKAANATEQKTAEIMAEVARSYPSDPSSRLNGLIYAKLEHFLQSHYLRFKLLDARTAAEARSSLAATGRKGKFGKKGGFEALLAAGLMMKGTLMAIGLGTLALLAGKALMTALMALTLSSMLGLKSLTGGGGKSTTYEIVTKPIYTSSHSHSVSHDEGGHGGGYGGHSPSGYGGYARAMQLELPDHLRSPQSSQ